MILPNLNLKCKLETKIFWRYFFTTYFPYCAPCQILWQKFSCWKAQTPLYVL